MLRSSFIRFLLVGLINTAVGLSIMYACLLLFHLSYWNSTFIGNLVGAAVSYMLNKNITFQSNARFVGSSIRFIIVILASYFIAYKLGLVLVEAAVGKSPLLTDYVEVIAVLFGSGMYTILNYLGQKYLVFSPKYQQVPGSVK